MSKEAATSRINQKILSRTVLDLTKRFWNFWVSLSAEDLVFKFTSGGSTFSRGERFPEKAKRAGGGVQLCVESPLSTGMDLGAACFRLGSVFKPLDFSFNLQSSLYQKEKMALSLSFSEGYFLRLEVP